MAQIPVPVHISKTFPLPQREAALRLKLDTDCSQGLKARDDAGDLPICLEIECAELFVFLHLVFPAPSIVQ